MATVKRALLAVGLVVALLNGGAASAAADYPPSGAVVVVSGEMLTGSTVSVTVHNCDVGEAIRTTIDSVPPVQSICESPVAGFTSARDVLPGRRAGLAQYDVKLPDEPGSLAGEVALLGSGQNLSFFIDVRAAPQPQAAATITPEPSGLPGWPFLLAAGLIVALMLVLARRRSNYETP